MIQPCDPVQEIANTGLYAIPFGPNGGSKVLEYPMLGAATMLEELAFFASGVASALYDDIGEGGSSHVPK